MKPKLKFFIIFNVICNLPTSIAMSLTASIMTGGINIMSGLLSILGFLIACALGAFIDVPRLNAGFAALFKLKRETFAGRAVGNVAASIIFTAAILAVMLIINVGWIFPAVIFAFLHMYPPLFIVAYLISFIMTPIALRMYENSGS